MRANENRLRDDKLVPAFPWLSALTRRLYDQVPGTDIPYWFLVIVCAVKADPSFASVLDL
jgi:hypothetical protein